MRTLRKLGFSALAALATGLAALPAQGQTGSPALAFATADGEWDRYVSPPTTADGPAAAPGAGAHIWYRVGIGAAALSAGGVFSYYVKHDFFAPYSTVEPRGARPPAAPGIRDPGPVASKPGGTGGDKDPPSVPPKDDGGTIDDPTSTSPTNNPPDGGMISEPSPPKTAPVTPPGPGDDVPTTVTPEPSTLVLLASGVLAFLFLNRRRRTA
jgi:hypothetical protein